MTGFRILFWLVEHRHFTAQFLLLAQLQPQGRYAAPDTFKEILGSSFLLQSLILPEGSRRFDRNR